MINLYPITKIFLQELKVKSTKKFLEHSILSHPQHTSMLAITDALDTYNIENMAIKVDSSKLDSLMVPCLVQERSLRFQVLKKSSDEKIICLNENGKQIEYSRNGFLENWTGICLLAETNQNSSEPGISKTLKVTRVKRFLAYATFIFLMTWFTSSLLASPLVSISRIYVFIYTSIKFIGLCVGYFLLWYEVDKFNPVVQNFCSGGKKVNCELVLDSKYAKLFGNGPSISIIAFSYFLASILYLAFSGFLLHSFSLLAFLSFTTAPVILLSLYYQAFIIKQWCKFCIIIEAVLALEIVSSILGGFYKYSIEIQTIPLLLGLLLTIILAWIPIKSLMNKEKESTVYERNLKRFKWDPEVFQGILTKNKRLINNVQGLGINLESKNSRLEVIKVCHPYCGPCSKAHPIFESLLEQGKISLQIIFLIGNKQNDIQTRLVKHFLAINEHQSYDIRKALEQWYGSDIKDFDSFVSSYPLITESKKHEEMINSMHEWCLSEQIEYTPTIFINGYQMPEEYSIEDLKEII